MATAQQHQKKGKAYVHFICDPAKHFFLPKNFNLLLAKND